MSVTPLEDVRECPVASPMRDIDAVIDYARSIRDGETVPVTDYDDIAYVLRSQSFALDRRTGHGFEWSMLLFGDAVSDLHGPQHFERRRLLSILFNKATLLQEYEHEFLVPAIEEWKQETFRDGHTREVDLVSTVRRLVVRVAARLVGLDRVQASEEDLVRFEELLTIVERGIRVHRFTDCREEVARAGLVAQRQMYEEYFTPAMERRLDLVERVTAGELPKEAIPTDLISLMAQHPDHYAAYGLDADLREATLLLIAQVGSTTNAVCFAIWDLVHWLRDHPGDRHRRVDPEFLMACFSESQRLGQVNTILRTAYEDETLPSGLKIRRGQVAVIDRPSGNADLARGGESEYEPHEFDPHRTLRDHVPGYGLAFGHGPHTCIGKRFVINEMSARSGGDKLGVGIRILQAFVEMDVTPVAEAPDFDASIGHRPTWVHLPVRVSV